jgi:nucleoside-diphosphate-sugar epimerase
VPILRTRGHAVIGTTRTPSKRDALQRLGAEAIVLDVLDRDAVARAVRTTRPDVIVHQATALTGALDPRRFEALFAPTNRLRSEGTAHLVAAAHEVGARTVAQSYAGWPYARVGGPVKTEDDPLDPTPPKAFRAVLDAIRSLETQVMHARGIVLRYGGFYGPGTSLSEDGEHARMLRKRQFPLIKPGTGIWSFVHIDDVAEATALAIEHGGSAIYNITDDEPAPVSEWLPYAAELAGAKPPYRIPRWLGRLMAGDHIDSLMNEARGASNAKAKKQLGWSLKYPTWRQGFRAAFSASRSG